MFEYIHSFFMIPIIFWLYILLLNVIYCIVTEIDDFYGIAFVTTVLGFVMYKNMFYSILLNWQLLVICCILYLIIGIIWSFWRWYKYCKNYLNTIKYENYIDRLNVSNNRSRIIGWVIFWPWSFIWNIIGDIFNWIFKYFRSIYTNISNKLIANKTIEGIIKK